MRILMPLLIVLLIGAAMFAGLMGFLYFQSLGEDEVVVADVAEPGPTEATPTLTESPVDASHLVIDFGEPADADASGSIYGVEILEDGDWIPERLPAKVGEPAVLQITNSGSVARDCVLGDEDYQDAFAAAYASGEVEEGPNVIAVGPKETLELKWVFELPGKVLLTCHDEGQYEEGLVATINVR